MPMLLGGYAMAIPVVRKISQQLEIVLSDFPYHLEWPVDDWLSDNDMLHIKAAQVGWLLEDPSSMETVIVWITEFRRVAQTSDATVIEQDKDIKMKAWLEGLVAEGLVWFSVFDKFRITLKKVFPPGKLGKLMEDVFGPESSYG